MSVLKSLTDEYFGYIKRTEDLIDISGLDVEVVSFKDNNGKTHHHGYRVKDSYEDEMAKTLELLIKKAIEKRGNECDLNDIDVSNIKKMNRKDDKFDISIGIFYMSEFNGDISGWDVSNVKDMERMFYKSEFNGNISKWDVKKVKNMCCMFYSAYKFNQPIGDWNVSEVTNMNGMFRSAIEFNQPLEDWGNKLGKVKDMSEMFLFAYSFNKPIGNWDVSGVEDMSRMFEGVTSFNQPIEDWDVSSVLNFRSMFQNAEKFNHPLKNWGDKFGEVRDMSNMFYSAKHFNKNLSGWKLDKQIRHTGMFDMCPIKEEYKPSFK